MSSPHKLYPCSACVARYGADDINDINDCCYRTCSQFVSGTQEDIIKSECGRQCRACVKQSVRCAGKNPCILQPGVPIIYEHPQYFKDCLDKNNNIDSAMECCLQRANSHQATQDCIDAYNSLIPGENTIEEYTKSKSKGSGLSPLEIVGIIIGVLILLFIVSRAISGFDAGETPALLMRGSRRQSRPLF